MSPPPPPPPHPASPAGPGPAPSADSPLGHIPLFARLSREEQRELMSLMRSESVAGNQTIVWLGDKGDTFYVISSGRVVVTIPNDKGEHVAINALARGSFFGELSLLDGGPRTASVRATEPTELLVLGREDFHAFLRKRPDAAIDILTVLGQRQRSNTEQMRGMSNANAAFEATRTTRWQRISDVVAAVAASQYFTAFHLCWFGTWIILNLAGANGLLPKGLAFDPFPFGLLTMVVSLEAIFLSIFVMVSQNRQSEKDRLRTDLDYQVNVKAQNEIMGITRRLDRIEALLTETCALKDAPRPPAHPPAHPSSPPPSPSAVRVPEPGSRSGD